MKDDFSETVNDNGALKAPDREMPGQYPTTAADIATAEKLEVKYGRFILGKDGNSALEQIMADCVSGKKLLAQEKWYFTKEGESVVVVKYFIRPAVEKPSEAAPAIQGRRRLKKAMSGAEG